MSNLYRRPSIDASYQVLVHLAKQFQRRRFFRNQPFRNKNCLWRPCLLTDWDKMSNLYKRTFHRCFLPSFGSFGHAVRGEDFQKQTSPFRNKNRLWWSYLLMDREEMSILYRGPPIDASYQVSVHLAKRFQRRRSVQKSINQKQELSVAATFVNGLGQNEQS